MNRDLKYYLIFNPAANQGRTGQLIASVQDFFKEWRLSFDLAVTKKPKEAIDLARQAAKNYPIIVAVGGDGTINEVVNGLAGTKAVMGIVPAGAGNDFSKAIGLKKKLRDNLEIILKNKVRKVDVGRVNDIYFINVLGIGFDALVAQEMDKRPKFLKGLPVYLYSFGRALKNYRFTKLKITTDNFSEEKEYLMVAAANGMFFGGGFNIAPRASVEDELFDVCLASPMKRNYLLKNIPKLIRGTHGELPEIRMLKTKKLRIESVEELPIEYDGELLRGQRRLEIEILPRMLNVIGN